MKRRLLLGLVVALLTASASFADEIYTFSFTDFSNPGFDFNFTTTSPDFITSAQVLSFFPISLASGFTLTQGLSLATPVAAFFNFGTSDVLLNPDGSVLYCPGGLCLPSEAISFAFVGGFPNSNGMYSPNAFALDGNDPVGYFENGSASLAIISTPEPSSGSLVFWGLLALLSLSFARMHLFKRRSHRNPSVACFD